MILLFGPFPKFQEFLLKKAGTHSAGLMGLQKIT